MPSGQAALCPALSRVVALAVVVVLVAGCGGKGANQNGSGAEESITIRGTVSSRGSTPFTILMIAGRDGLTYIIEGSLVVDELRQLEGMDVEVSGVKTGTREELTVVSVDYYDMLPLPSGERPVVGVVELKQRGDGGTELAVVDDRGRVWIITGDFRDTLRSFLGAKVWVAGDSAPGTGIQTLLVRDYGILRR